MSATDDAITKLLADVASENTELASLETLAAGLTSSLDAAIAAAAAGGATAAQLAQLTSLSTTIEAKTTEIHAAVLANTPAAANPANAVTTP